MQRIEADDNPFGLAEIKAHLRVEHDAEDDVIARYCDAALDWFERVTDHYLRYVTLEQVFTSSPVELPTRPFVEIVRATDEDANTVTVTTEESYGGVTVCSWDTLQDVKLRWKVGYEERKDIPPMSVAAIRVLVGDLYVYRNIETMGAHSPRFVSAGIFLGDARGSV